MPSTFLAARPGVKGSRCRRLFPESGALVRFERELGMRDSKLFRVGLFSWLGRGKQDGTDGALNLGHLAIVVGT